MISVRSETNGPDGPAETVLATRCGPRPGLHQTHEEGLSLKP